MTAELSLECTVAAMLVAAGLAALLFPSLLQRIARRLPFNPWRHYISTPSYLAHTRIVGVLALSMAALLLVDLYVRSAT